MKSVNELREGVIRTVDNIVKRIALDLQTIVEDGMPITTESSGVLNAVPIDQVGYLGIMEELDLADVLIPQDRHTEPSVYLTEKGNELYESLKANDYYTKK